QTRESLVQLASTILHHSRNWRGKQKRGLSDLTAVSFASQCKCEIRAALLSRADASEAAKVVHAAAQVCGTALSLIGDLALFIRCSVDVVRCCSVFFSSRRRHTRLQSSDVCSSD